MVSPVIKDHKKQVFFIGCWLFLITVFGALVSFIVSLNDAAEVRFLTTINKTLQMKQIQQFALHIPLFSCIFPLNQG